MLNNLLTFFHKNYSLVILGMIASSCAIKPISNIKKQEALVQQDFCSENYTVTEKKHLVMAAKIKSSVLANCFRNFLKFETDKKQNISVCNQLSIKKNGRVSYVQVTNVNRRVMPKDFKMCIEQEYWKMDFEGLQLEKSHLIEFQLNFTSV